MKLIQELTKLNESPNSELTDAHFTDASVAGAVDLHNLLQDVAQDWVNEHDAIDYVESEEGQGTVGDNNSLSFDHNTKLKFDGKHVIFDMELEDYFRDRHDEKRSNSYVVPCYLTLPMVDGKIVSAELKRLLDDEDSNFDIHVGTP